MALWGDTELDCLANWTNHSLFNASLNRWEMTGVSFANVLSQVFIPMAELTVQGQAIWVRLNNNTMRQPFNQTSVWYTEVQRSGGKMA